MGGLNESQIETLLRDELAKYKCDTLDELKEALVKAIAVAIVKGNETGNIAVFG